ncbi:MAG: hypothetical protein KKD92_05020 [Proteobacteria bacterium]|nr:hypothetical protein [Pseudomonadota bacterium]
MPETKQAPSRHQVGTKQGPSDKPSAGPKELSSEQFRILKLCMDAKAIADLMKVFDRSNRTKFKKSLIEPLMAEGLLEMTEPGSPNSPTQKYRTTEKGRQAADNFHD